MSRVVHNKPHAFTYCLADHACRDIGTLYVIHASRGVYTLIDFLQQASYCLKQVYRLYNRPSITANHYYRAMHYTVQSAVLLSHVVCLSVRLSVTLVDHDHIGWKSWKL